MICDTYIFVTLLSHVYTYQYVFVTLLSNCLFVFVLQVEFLNSVIVDLQAKVDALEALNGLGDQHEVLE